jgi:hypothetical protein
MARIFTFFFVYTKMLERGQLWQIEITLFPKVLKYSNRSFNSLLWASGFAFFKKKCELSSAPWIKVQFHELLETH